MPQARMLRTIRNNKHGGLLREGMVVTAPQSQIDDWGRVTPKIAEPYHPPTGARAAPMNAAIPEAPSVSDRKGNVIEPPVGRRGAGSEKRSSSSRQGRRSTRKT